MSNPHCKLGDRIRRLLDDSAISQRELARRLGVGPNQVSRWVLGTVAPTYTVLNDILKTCRKTSEAGWLLTGKGSQEQCRTPELPEDNAQSINTTTEEEAEVLQKELLQAKNEIIELLKINASLREQLASGKDAPLMKSKTAN